MSRQTAAAAGSRPVFTNRYLGGDTNPTKNRSRELPPVPGAVMTTYTYYLSRDINLEVRLKVSELVLQKISPETEVNPQVYVSCQLYADGHPLSIGSFTLCVAATPTWRKFVSQSFLRRHYLNPRFVFRNAYGYSIWLFAAQMERMAQISD
jgi:hypothetical protein